MDKAVERVFEQLQGAERDRRRVQFGYTDKNGARTQRRVDPYGFIVSNGRVYLVGYDHTRVDMRVFAVDNVLDVAVTPQTYEKPPDFNLDAYGANSVSGVFHTDTVTEVTVRFSPVIAKAAAAASTVARDRRVVRRDDGGLDITYRVADPLEIVRWSLRWGAEAEVLEPAEARRSAAEIARRLAERYAAGTPRPRARVRTPIMMRPLKPLVLLAALAVLICSGAARAAAPAGQPIDGIRCDQMEGAVLHIHQHLAIRDHGKPVGVPDDVGRPLIAQCFYWIHTHTPDGIIHIESPNFKSFTLGNFFDVWGEPLTQDRRRRREDEEERARRGVGRRSALHRRSAHDPADAASRRGDRRRTAVQQARTVHAVERQLTLLVHAAERDEAAGRGPTRLRSTRESRSASPRRSAQPGGRHVRLGVVTSVGLAPSVTAAPPASFSLLAVDAWSTCTHHKVSAFVLARPSMRSSTRISCFPR